MLAQTTFFYKVLAKGPVGVLFQCDVFDDGFYLGVIDGTVVDGYEHQALLGQFGVEVVCRLLCFLHCHVEGVVAEFDVALVRISCIHIAGIGLVGLAGSVGIGIDGHGAPGAILQFLLDAEVLIFVVAVLLPGCGHDHGVILGLQSLAFEFGDAIATSGEHDCCEGSHDEAENNLFHFVFCLMFE